MATAYGEHGLLTTEGHGPFRIAVLNYLGMYVGRVFCSQDPWLFEKGRYDTQLPRAVSHEGYIILSKKAVTQHHRKSWKYILRLPPLTLACLRLTSSKVIA